MWRCEPTKVWGGQGSAQRDHKSEWSIFNVDGSRVARVQAAGGSAKATAELIVRAVNSLMQAETEMRGFSPETIADLQKTQAKR